MQAPPQIQNVGNFRPRGYYSNTTIWPVYPNSSNLYWNSDDILRFLITITQGVMDPYRSHIQLTVSCDQATLPVGGLQIDNSAQSFISQSVVSSNSVQVERITQYDTLAAYLTDIGFSEYVCQGRDAQGLGFSSTSTHAPYSNGVSRTGQTFMNWTGTDLQVQNVSHGLVMPTTAPSWGGRGNGSLATNSGNEQTAYQIIGATSVAPSNSNVLWLGVGQTVTTQNVHAALGRFGNVRAQYMQNLLGRNYPDSPSSYLQIAPQVTGQVWNTTTMMNNSTTSGYSPTHPYKLAFPTTNKCVSYIDGKATTLNLPNTTNLYGLDRPIVGEFCRGSCEAMISPTIPQCQMQNGVILPSAIPVAKKTFRIPLISAICGILIPPDQFLLIPMKALYNLLLQITLSRFAMFTAGYCDVHEFDKVGMSNQQKRAWKISQVAWNLHLYTFPDSQVNGLIQASLTREIPITVNSYILASQYQLPSGAIVRNNWPINLQSESTCEIICLFLSNDYQSKSFCRKQFRLSNNITSMQVKFNTQFFPTQPINGNAGNPEQVDETGNNWPYYQLLLLSSNYLFNTNFPLPKINPRNFAINERCYDVNAQQTFYDPAMYNNMAYTWTSSSVNANTAMGMPFFHQNRYIGKAAFVWSFEPYGHSKEYMNGLNTIGTQNFSIQFNTSTQNQFPRDQTLYIFGRSNTITVFGNDGVKQQADEK